MRVFGTGEDGPVLPRTSRRRTGCDRPIGFSVLVFALAVACQNATPEHNDVTPQPPAPETTVATSSSDSLRLSLEGPDRVRTGDPVPIVVRAENITDWPLTLYLTGRTVAFDLIVTDEEGAVVWRRLEDQVVPQILRVETLSPGDVLELRETWRQDSNAGAAVTPGSYLVRAEILTEEQPLVTPEHPLRILPKR